jgi:hypothetical protein
MTPPSHEFDSLTVPCSLSGYGSCTPFFSWDVAKWAIVADPLVMRGSGFKSFLNLDLWFHDFY